VIREDCKLFLQEIAKQHGIEIYELQVEPDHIHMFADLPPTMSVCKALQLLKRDSSYKLFRQHPWLRKHFRKGHFWSPGKFFRSVGNVTSDVIRAYIDDSHHGWHFLKQRMLFRQDLIMSDPKLYRIFSESCLAQV
ncbi:MAG: IS200/IS605 family transposase, partial [Chloroflexi bacterium]|nr:IS200/IS605 family transposase [Chloroflexota bacterium]